MKSFKISNYDIGMPAILAGAGILTLIICMIVLIPGRKAPDETNGLQEAVTRMETRIAALESRLESTLTAAAPDPESAEAPSEAVVPEVAAQIQSMAEELAGIQKKLEHIDRRQGNLEQRVVGFTSPPPKRESQRKRAESSASTRASSKKEAPSQKHASSVKQDAAPAAKKETTRKQVSSQAPKREIAEKQPSPQGEKKKLAAAKQPPAESAPAKSAKYHLVAAGETRYGIARKYGLSVAQLNAINGFTEETILQPGQKIVLQK